MPIDKSHQRKHYNKVVYHNNKWTTESYKFLHLGWSSMEGCWWGPHRTCQSAALWCTTGAQQRVGDESRRDIPVHIHAEQFYFFPFLARTLHSFHNWKDIALEIICIFQFIHCTRLKTNDEGKHIPMDECLLERFQEDPLLSQLQTPISWRLWTGSLLCINVKASGIPHDNENGKGTLLYWSLSHKEGQQRFSVTQYC